MKQLIQLFFIALLTLSYALAYDQNTLNLYIWGGEIPNSVIRDFERTTGIKVNISTYDSNEIMYAKLKAAGNPGYDLLLPSSYFVDRMRRENMLEKIDKTAIPNFKNIDEFFLNKTFDPQNEYSIPYIWGATGIFANNKYFNPNSIKKWIDLWQERFKNKLLMLDDPREVFSIALITLGYNVNDTNPQHIEQAYENLKKLWPNIRIFNSDSPPTMLIDEDVSAGMVWNGDAFKAQQENPAINFIFPEDGFVIWVDNFSIPQNAPHKDNAYKFLNFIFRPEMSARGVLTFGFASTNAGARQYLPESIRNSDIIYPDKTILQRGQFQTDVSDQALALYEKYWELLKLGG